MLVEKLQESSWGPWRVGSALDVLTHVADLKRGVALMEATGKPLSSTPGTLTPKLKLLEQWDLYYLAATACCRMRLSLRLLAGQVKPDLQRGSAFTLLHQRHSHLKRTCHESWSLQEENPN